MQAVDECRAKAEHYAKLAERAKSPDDRDRLLRMKRSYELMARGAEFDAALDDTIRELKRKMA
jgi:hypothetical protein